MNKWLKIGLGAFLVLIVLGMIGSSSKTTNTNPTIPPSSTNLSPPNSPAANPAVESSFVSTVNTFEGVVEGDVIRFYFQLEDPDGDNTTSSGNATIALEDSTGNELYAETFAVNKSDFQDYHVINTGASVGKAYEKRFSISKVKKSTSKSGTAKLTFTTFDGKVLNQEATVFNLPSYTDEELKQMFEDDYQKNAKTIDKTVKEGYFTVKVAKAGVFNARSYGFSDDEYLYRVDIEVTNTTNDDQSFYSSGVLIDNEKNQYDYEYGGTSFGSIYPDVTKKGYLLFQQPNESATYVNLILDCGYEGYFTEAKCEFQLPLK